MQMTLTARIGRRWRDDNALRAAGLRPADLRSADLRSASPCVAMIDTLSHS
jgi:hypothetical protein